jgi:hypothetical protein
VDLPQVIERVEGVLWDGEIRDLADILQVLIEDSQRLTGEGEGAWGNVRRPCR